jgi:MinD-like ATPase involved in chromosome partitioning or flagellar assembly
VLVPSDRSIPRALTTGLTIYEADPKSGAARAFETLARRYSDLAGVAAASKYVDDAASTTSGESDPSSGRRLRLKRRGN